MVKLVLILIMSLSLFGGIIGDTVKGASKGAVIYGAKKGFNYIKKSKAKKALTQNQKKKIFKKNTVNGRTVYQRDIRLDYAHKDRYGNTISNQERMKKGQAPYELNPKSGKSEQVQLHHSRQKHNGSLFELKESTHLKKNSKNGNNALHPYGKNKNPNNPVDRASFNKERKAYWKQRAKDLLGTKIGN